MQRSKQVGSNADKQWEAERRGAKRAEARLSNGIQEIEEAQLYHVNSMIKEQKRIQRDLMRIKQASNRKTAVNPKSPPTDYRAGRLPGEPTNSGGKTQNAGFGMGGESQGKTSAPKQGVVVMASGSSVTLQMRINDFVDGVSSRRLKTESTSVKRPDPKSPSREVNVAAVNNSFTKTLSISEDQEQSLSSESVMEGSGKADIVALKPPKELETSRMAHSTSHSVKQRRGSLQKERLIFDEEVYAPDGSLRTVHTMPDLMESLEEAKKARYIRHRNKPDFEKELSVQEIFQRDGKTHAN